MWRQFGWRAPASLAAGSRELARHASSARSRLHDHQRGLAEGRAAQPHGSVGKDEGFHASVENVLCQCSQTVAEPITMMTMPTTVISMTLSEKSSALHSWPRLL